MIPIMILVLMISNPEKPEIKTEQIQFRTMESCYAAALRLERELSQFNAVALCIDRAI